MEPGPQLWDAVREELARKAPMQCGYAAEASFLRVEGRQFFIGVPEIHRNAAQNLERANVKTLIEDILAKLSGTRFTLKVEVRADIEVAPAPEVSAPPSPEPAPAAEKPSPKQAKTAALEEAAAQAAKFEEEFRDDPLIQEALKLFDAKIAKMA